MEQATNAPTFTVTFPTITFTVADIWPNDDAPDNPTWEDVRSVLLQEAAKKFTHPAVTNDEHLAFYMTLREWAPCEVEPRLDGHDIFAWEEWNERDDGWDYERPDTPVKVYYLVDPSLEARRRLAEYEAQAAEYAARNDGSAE